MINPDAQYPSYRDILLAHALQGILANPSISINVNGTHERMATKAARLAIEVTDELALSYGGTLKKGEIIYDGPADVVDNALLKKVYGRELTDDDIMDN
jgi:hypothetical protein